MKPTSEGEAAQKTARLAPKVRMVQGGDASVNLLRSELSGSVQVQYDQDLEGSTVLDLSVDDLAQAAPIGKVAVPPPLYVEEEEEEEAEPPAPEDAAEPPDVPESKMSVFVQLSRAPGSDTDEGKLQALLGGLTRVGDLIVADLSKTEIDAVSENNSVSLVEPGEPIKHPRPEIIAGVPDAPVGPTFLNDPRLDGVETGGGEGVLIGIIDVEGFDFAHQDFLSDDGTTRFVRIWDQGGEVRDPPAGFEYGSEFTKDHLDNALGQNGFPATSFEPQSAMRPGSHGTHVASIAAGNSGICPGAEIAGVLIALDESDLDRRRSLYDSTRIAHGVLYLTQLAEELNRQLVINISLGTNGHAHDASSPTSRWLDALLVQPGRAVCVAAGNAGQMDPMTSDDIGFVLGRVHCNGRIAAAGLRTELEWVVVGDGIEDISENELEVWYPPQDRFAVQVKPPGGGWSREVEPRQYFENHALDDGTRLSIYNELYHTANGANHISIFLSPFFDLGTVRGVAHGTWKVRLIGREIRDGRFDCWIERDDPRPLNPGGGGKPWRFPSFFGPNTFSRSSTVSSLACGQRVVSVANHDPTTDGINVTSSLGPTRDGRSKPDIAAPGTAVVAAKGFTGPNDPWVAMSGTSMSSPYVSGVAALMLAVEPELTASQIVGIIRRTAEPLPGADFDWRANAGFGTLNPAACIAEASRFKSYTDLDHAEPIA